MSEKAEKLESEAEGLQGADFLKIAPAPWRSAEFGLTPVEGPTYYRITDANGVPVAMTYGYSLQDWLLAQAIAAVPDLVEALTEIVALPGFEPDEPYGRKAVAALAKARGQQP